jgi:hypothetical protein
MAVGCDKMEVAMSASSQARKTTGSASTEAARKRAERAYERALRDAGVSRDDLAVLRELAEHSRSLGTGQFTAQPSRIYL